MLYDTCNPLTAKVSSVTSKTGYLNSWKFDDTSSFMNDGATRTYDSSHYNLSTSTSIENNTEFYTKHHPIPCSITLSDRADDDFLVSVPVLFFSLRLVLKAHIPSSINGFVQSCT